MRRLVRDHPLVVFVILAYVLSWWSVPFAAGGILPHGPALAALAVVAATRGGGGARKWLRSLLVLPRPRSWLLVGPGLVLAYLAVAFGLQLVLGGTISGTEHLDGVAVTLLVLLVMGGMWEEPGWTGYALPLLQDRYADRRLGLLLASLHLGVIRAVWHLPLALFGTIPWYDVVFFAMAFQFLISWLYNRTGSVPSVMLFHLASNVVGGAVLVPLFTGADRTRFYVLFIATAWLLALLLNRPHRWSMGRRTSVPGRHRVP